MKKLPTLLAILFIVITLFRVGTFADVRMKAGPLGWVFSIALGAAVFSTSYWKRVSAVAKDGNEDRRSKWTRRQAGAAQIFFVVVDGFFNLYEVWSTTTPPQGDTFQAIAVVAYGAFPTVAAAVLGTLQGYVDRLPSVAGNSGVMAALRRLVARWLDSLGGSEISAAAPVVSISKPATVELEPPQEPAKLPEATADWRQLTDEQKAQMAGMTAAEILVLYPAIKPRTARDWAARLKEHE